MWEGHFEVGLPIVLPPSMNLAFSPASRYTVNFDSNLARVISDLEHNLHLAA